MKKQHKIGLAGVAFLTVAGLVAFATQQPSSRTLLDASINAVAPIVGQSIEQRLRTYSGQVKTESSIAGGPSAAENKDGVYSEIFEKHPELLESVRLQQVVLFDETSKAKWKELYSNKEHIEKAFDRLANLDKMNFDLDGNIERMYTIDFLKNAASIADNPNRNLIKTKLVDLTTTLPEAYAALNDESKKNYMGDKIELYYVLLKFFPSDLEGFKKTLTNHKLQELYKYARRNVENMAQIELNGRQ